MNIEEVKECITEWNLMQQPGHGTRPPIRTASSARAYVASIAHPNANASHRAPIALVPPSPWIAEHVAYLRRNNNKDEDKNATSPTSLPAMDLVTPVSRDGSPTSCTSAKTAHPHTPTGGGGQPKCHCGSSRCRADTESDTDPAAPTDEDELAALRVENYKLSLDVDNANRLNSALTLTNRTLLEDLTRLDNELTVSKLHRELLEERLERMESRLRAQMVDIEELRRGRDWYRRLFLMAIHGDGQ